MWCRVKPDVAVSVQSQGANVKIDGLRVLRIEDCIALGYCTVCPLTVSEGIVWCDSRVEGMLRFYGALDEAARAGAS